MKQLWVMSILGLTVLLAGCGGSGDSGGSAGVASARCMDGSLSYSQHRSGTCSSHGGVAQWLAGAPSQ